MQIADKYKIVKPLGNHQGRKFGSLFLVSNKKDGLLGTMKVVAKTDQSTVAVERLRAESRFRFNFKGLPEVLDFYESDNELILVRKYIEAESILDRFEKTKKRLRHIFLCEILKQLGVILDHLHQQSIYHCDIKPGNILIDKDNQVHLIDFGLALNKSLHDDRKLLFPLGYAAPELLLNHLTLVDHRTDYFALGVTLWRLYSGKLPLAHPNPSIFTNLQLTHPLPESDQVSKSMQIVLNKMCSKHSFLRPPNTIDSKEVQEKLQDAMNNRYANFSTFLRDFQEAGNKGLLTKKYRGDTLD